MGSSAAIAADTLVTYGDSRPMVELDRFWRIGTGRAVPLGAVHASCDRLETARGLAERGCRAGSEFDQNCARPLRLETLRLSTRKD